jgi:hypothetical protein
MSAPETFPKSEFQTQGRESLVRKRILRLRHFFLALGTVAVAWGILGATGALLLKAANWETNFVFSVVLLGAGAFAFYMARVVGGIPALADRSDRVQAP